MHAVRPLVLLTTAVAVLVASPGRVQAEAIDFDRDIAPIFEERCWHCHGEDEAESGLRLDRRSRVLRGGDSGLAAVVPGQPEQSYLLDVVKHLDPEMKMPPDEDRLAAEEIARLEAWIRQGAVWPGQMAEDVEDDVELWSFQPVVRPPVPAEAGVPTHPVDAFLWQRLHAEGLTMASLAEPRAVLRRLSVLLTGLPPTWEETQAFVAASAVDHEAAYAAAVERLLASPHFGERWAQHWLDVIRWAETNGSEANLYRKNAWVYRDYVIRAFNADTPYDQFLREQLAGDTLGVGEATGFLVAGPHVPAATVGREPAAIRQARADRLDEIMQTVGASVMGVTIGCARCHNHKFDPLTIRDYYAMTAVFQDVEFGSRHPEYRADHPLQQRGDAIWRELEEKRATLQMYGGWEENWGAYRELHFKPVTTQAVRVRFKMPAIFLDELEVFGSEKQAQNLALSSRGTRISGFPEDGFETRNPISRLNDGEFGTMIWRVKKEPGDEPAWVQFDFPQAEQISRLRLSNNREYFYETDYLERKANLPRYEFDVDVLADDGTWKPWVGTWAVNKKLPQEHPQRQAVLDEVQQLIAELAEQGPRPSFVGRLTEPPVTHVLLRGSPESPRDEVFPAAPAALAGQLGLTSEASGSDRRKSFATWVTQPSNPLTARVMVNRVWHHLFGTGLVTTTSDFGMAGAAPTHPALLNWLAAEFVEPTVSQGPAWSTKSLIRLLVMSKAFRQSSEPRERPLAVDAGSALLWRFPPKRVEAEVIRDTILQASGHLDLAIGGRSYRIHNEKATYAQWQVVDNHGPHTWRRMLYQERMRRVDDQLFTAFDFPDCGQVRAKRPVSTTPLQALNLLNSRFVIDQSERIAARAEEEARGDAAVAVDRCFELLLGRQPTAEERAACLEVRGSGELSLVCRALINSNEFAFLP